MFRKIKYMSLASSLLIPLLIAPFSIVNAEGITPNTEQTSTSSSSAELTSNADSSQTITNRNKINASDSVDVDSYESLKNALTNINVRTINLKNDITVTDYIDAKLSNQTLTINGQGHQLLFNNGYTIRFKDPGKIDVKDISLSQHGDGYVMFDTNSKHIDFNFSDIRTLDDNVGYLIQTLGDVSFSGQKNILKSNTSYDDYNKYSLVEAHNIAIKENAKVAVETRKIVPFKLIGVNPVFESTNANVKIESGTRYSHIYLAGDDPIVNISGGVFILKSSNTKISKSWYNDSGMIWDNKTNGNVNQAKINFSNHANVKLETESMNALHLTGNGSQINVDSANVNITSNNRDTDSFWGYYLGSAVRFGVQSVSKGNALLSLMNKAHMTVNQNHGRSAAIRMTFGGNQIKTSGGSTLKVHKKTPGGIGEAPAVEYDRRLDKNDSFDITDEDSYVFLDSNKGPAILSSSNTDINLSNHASFLAYGNTDSTGVFAFNHGTVSIHIDNPNIFDFKNSLNSKSSGLVSNVKEGDFTIENSMFSIWDQSSNVNKLPTKEFAKFHLELYGANFNTVKVSSNPEFFDFYNGKNLTKISRISSNNTGPLIAPPDTPTNADKKLYINAQVQDTPESKRNAFQHEVHLEGKINGKDSQVTNFEGSTDGTMDTYIRKHQEGYVAIKLPGDKYLQSGEVVKIKRAYRGTKENPIESKTLPEEVSVIDIVPPEPAKITQSVSSHTQYLEGTGEPNANVSLTIDGMPTNTNSKVDSKGNFKIKLPDGLKDNDKIQIFLRDNAGTANIEDKPITNNDVGNINPDKDLVYHDKIFKAAPIITVKGALEFNSPSSINFGDKIKLSPATLHLKGVNIGDLVVSDTRPSNEKTNWNLALKQSKRLIDAKVPLRYVNRANEDIEINETDQIIEHNLPNKPEEDKISEDWSKKDHGLFLDIPPESQKIGPYSGVLNWTLQDTPDTN